MRRRQPRASRSWGVGRAASAQARASSDCRNPLLSAAAPAGRRRWSPWETGRTRWARGAAGGPLAQPRSSAASACAHPLPSCPHTSYVDTMICAPQAACDALLQEEMARAKQLEAAIASSEVRARGGAARRAAPRGHGQRPALFVRVAHKGPRRPSRSNPTRVPSLDPALPVTSRRRPSRRRSRRCAAAGKSWLPSRRRCGTLLSARTGGLRS